MEGGREGHSKASFLEDSETGSQGPAPGSSRFG